MKKITVIILSLLLLVGCSQSNVQQNNELEESNEDSTENALNTDNTDTDTINKDTNNTNENRGNIKQCTCKRRRLV